MALLHRAEINPSKLDLLTVWLPTRPWYPGPGSGDLERVAAYRFDDPAGAVGIETLVVRAGDGPLLQVPLTYRDAPLEGRERWLVGTTEHSVLGRRWVYDGCGDPVYASVLTHTILTGGGAAEEFVEVDGRLERRPATMSVRGGGAPDADVPSGTAVVRVDDDDPTIINTECVELAVVRVLGGPGAAPAPDASSGPTLTGTWVGSARPLLLAEVRG